MTKKLVLARHSQSQPQPGIPASQWHLSREGEKRCRPLADRLASFEPQCIYSSTEPKACETATLVADHLGVGTESREGLHEHLRERVPFVTQAEYDEVVARMFSSPEALVYGEETAVQARARFGSAMDRLLSEQPPGNLVVVAHGTVISLFVADKVDVNPLELWNRLGMPAYAVLELPALDLLEVVEEVL